MYSGSSSVGSISMFSEYARPSTRLSRVVAWRSRVSEHFSHAIDFLTRIERSKNVCSTVPSRTHPGQHSAEVVRFARPGTSSQISLAIR